jgi:protocatechuate 3,4-dioxygenase alpha subunit
MFLVAFPSQTVGPFFNFGLTTNEALGKLARDGAQGERISLSFRVADGDGNPASTDAMVEIWQADANGKYDHWEDKQAKIPDPNLCGFGRMETDENGTCVFDTVKPGRVPGPDGTLQAPHICVQIFARGLLKQLYTRVYFAGEPANEQDPVLALVPPHRRETLLAHPVAGMPHAWHFDVRLQGETETVFFDV